MALVRRVLDADPRYYQLAVLGGLLAYGLLALDFDASPAQVGVTIVAALLAQSLGCVVRRLPWDARSALISACSLSLLLRTNDLWLAATAATVALGSKFVLRIGGKHLFNPANLGIVAALALSERAWVSPGQWGSVAFFGFLMACLGTVVVTRAARADVAFAFLASYAAMMVARAL
jgi:Na+-transporting NADH:ubiquinone oxidoreductase subunit NqrB